MFDLKKLGEVALRQGMKLLADPRVMKVMSDPRVMKLTMQAFTLRGDLQSAVDERWRKLAHRFHLATEAEVTTLETRIRDLEDTVDELRAGEPTPGLARHY
jgi:hypothetical protein